MRLVASILTLFIFFPILLVNRAEAQPVLESTDRADRLQQAFRLLEKAETRNASPYWPGIDPASFFDNVKKNLRFPERIYQGHQTNFCGYAAFSVVFCREQPDVYVQHLINLFQLGKTKICTDTVAISEPVRMIAGKLRGKGKLEVNPADQLWLLALPDIFKAYMNIDKRYKPGDENTIWAACTLGKFNDMARALGNYTVTSRGTDLLRPKKYSRVSYLREELKKGRVVLYVNSKYLHPSKFRILVLRAPTHFIVLYDVEEKDGLVFLKYWDYGLKTLEIMTPKRLRKMTFGVISLTDGKK